jgi:DNA-binding beta-propeller fold protein YncE
LAVTNPVTVSSNTPPFRMRYVRTDTVIEYDLWINPSWIIYNPPTNRFFVTDPLTNHVFVLDAATETMIGTIIVPGAFNIDDTADRTSLYVGTQIGDIYVINPVTMAVTRRYLASQVGPNGYTSYSVYVMNDGILALLGLPTPLPNLDGYRGLAFWNPATNSLVTNYLLESGSCGPAVSIFSFSRTPDRTKVFLAGSGGICEIDATTGTAVYTQPDRFMLGMAFSPDGKWLVT